MKPEIQNEDTAQRRRHEKGEIAYGDYLEEVRL